MTAQGPASAKLDCQLRIRLTESERATLEREADDAGITLSDLVRSRVIRGARIGGRAGTPRPATSSFQSMSPELFAQLSRIGNNLNQVARALNSGLEVPRPDAMRIVADLWEIMLQDEVAARYAHAAGAKVMPRANVP